MNLVSIFSIPIWESEFPEFYSNRKIFLECVNEVEKTHPNKEQTLYLNGYQSPKGILTKQEILFPLFEYTIQTAIKATMDLSFVSCRCFLSNACVNTSKSKSSVLFNTTQRDTFTGIFFLKQPPNSGKFFISNPAINPVWQGGLLVENKNEYNSEKIHIQPNEGQLFVFPSYLSYGIEPNNHNEESICIAMSIIAMPEEVCTQFDNEGL